MLKKLMLSSGRMIKFYTNFHCELDFITKFWGAAKRYARKNCNFSWLIERDGPKSIEIVNLDEIHHHYRKAQRYIDVYRKWFRCKAAEYAIKKYRSHRRVPNSILMDINCFTASYWICTTDPKYCAPALANIYKLMLSHWLQYIYLLTGYK